MTYQDFNNIYYTFTGNKKGIRPSDRVISTGYELKEFLEYAVEQIKNKEETMKFDF